MPQDIRAGDVVVCVDDSPCRLPRIAGLPFPYPRGSVWRVLQAKAARSGRVGLILRGGPKPYVAGSVGWHDERFRKLNDEPDNIELVERIKRPVRIPDLPRVTTEVRKLNPDIWGEEELR